MEMSTAVGILAVIALVAVVGFLIWNAEQASDPEPANTILIVHADQLKNGKWRWVACWIATGKVACRGPVNNKTPKGAMSHAGLVFAGLPIEIGPPVYYEQKISR